jgi:hypothetical protein
MITPVSLMPELISATSLVVSIISLLGTLALARELGLLAQRARIEPEPATRVLGTAAHAVRTRAVDGSDIDVPPASDALVIFALPGCPPCDVLLKEVSGADALPALGMPYVLVMGGSASAARSFVGSLSIDPARIVLDPEEQVFQRFGRPSAPRAFLVTSGLITGQRVVNSLQQLREFVLGGSGVGAAHAHLF